MHLFYTPEIVTQHTTQSNTTFYFTLNEEESKHCIRVLRLIVGDKICLIDGVGNWYNAEITDDNAKHCTVCINEVIKEFEKRNHRLHIAIAPTKNMDRLEWFIEKATEIGIDEISFIDCKNSERPVIKLERVSKVAVSAVKQSLKAYMPKLNEMLTFNKFIVASKSFSGQKFIAHCYKSEQKQHLQTLYQKGNAALILIGPEGDFTNDEVQLALANGFKQIGLGTSRLRTETAALYATTCINLKNE